MNDLLKESDVAKTVNDFEQFCMYIQNHRPAVTAKGNLPPKVCFELNQHLSVKEDDATPTNKMESYPSIILWLEIGKASGIICVGMATKKKRGFVCNEEIYTQFQSLSIFSKYALLFQTWVCFVDMEEIYGDSVYQLRNLLGLKLFFAQFSMCKTNQWIQRDPSVLEQETVQQIQSFMTHQYRFLQAMANFHWIDCETVASPPDVYEKKVISRLRPTDLGKLLVETFDPTTFFQSYLSKFEGTDIFESEEAPESPLYRDEANFLTPFLSMVPPGSIDMDAIYHILFQEDFKGTTPEKTRYEFKVTISRTCHCTIICGGQHTFEELHHEIQYAFDFDDDHLYSFYLDGNERSSYSVHSPGAQAFPSAGKVRIGDVRLLQNQRIGYLFDYGDCWYFLIELVRIYPCSEILRRPTTENFVGEAPLQYGNWMSEDDGDK